MSAIRSSTPSPSFTEEPTPKPASAVGTKSSVDNEPGASPRDAERKAALLQYFANPSREMNEMDAAWQEALALYGDEDSDAWVSALEDGTHPLCKVRVERRRCA